MPRDLNAQPRVMNTSVVSHLFALKACLQAFCMCIAWTLQNFKIKLILWRRKEGLNDLLPGQIPCQRHLWKSILAGPTLVNLWISGIPSLNLSKQGNMTWQGSSFDVIEGDISRRHGRCMEVHCQAPDTGVLAEEQFTSLFPSFLVLLLFKRWTQSP